MGTSEQPEQQEPSLSGASGGPCREDLGAESRPPPVPRAHLVKRTLQMLHS